MAEIKYITAKELENFYNTSNVMIFDIREKGEFAREHIPGAKNTPLSQWNVSEFNMLNDETPVVFHCQSGNRTGLNENKLKALECKTVYVLNEGFSEWKNLGFAINENLKAPLPIMRQVQIIAGSLILIGVILSFFISPYFSLLSGFVGLGLLFAGITGYCGMANLLMHLPYNKPKL